MQSKRDPIIIVLALFAVLLAGAAFILLQGSDPADERGTLSGTVVDASDGSFLKGVSVTAVDRDGERYTSHENTDTTGDDGFFSLELPPNDYTLTFEADGYEPFETSSSYTVKKDKDTKIDEAFRLAAAAAPSEAPGNDPASGAAADAGSDTDTSSEVAADSAPAEEQVAVDSTPASEQTAAPVNYVVYCKDEIGNLLSSSTNRGTVGSKVVVNAPQITDYIAQTSQQEITLSADESSNAVTFYYESAAAEAVPSSYTIPPDAITYNGHSYYADRVSFESISSYWEAENYCESLGGHLAVITDNELNKVLYGYVFNTLGYESAYFGLTRGSSGDGWNWVNGSGSTYRNWASGQPDNQNGKENYALFYYKDKPYSWNDGDFGPDEAGTVTFLMEWDTE